MLVDILLMAVGVTALVAGAEFLVRGASSLAIRLGLSPLVIGLTVVAYGTSAPELAVSLGAATGGTTDVALGNVVGSNIFNVLVILGISALVRAQVVHRRLVQVEVPLMVGVTGLVVVIALATGEVGRPAGIALIAGGIGFSWWLVRSARRSPQGEPDAPGTGRMGTLPAAGLVLAGLVGLVLGSQAMVGGATSLAADLGVSELIVGLTIVAAGTSLPELATSLVAARRGQTDIAVGNVVGSNIFNLLIVLGATATVLPVPAVGGGIRIDLIVMAAVAVLCLPVFFTGHRISRWEGAVLVTAYLGYTAYLILRETGSPMADEVGWLLLAAGLPPVALTLAVVSVRQIRAGRGEATAG